MLLKMDMEVNNKIKKERKAKNKILILFAFCVIILMSNYVYADDNLTLREFEFESKPIKVYTDAIRYHVKANGYENKYKDDLENNFYRYTSGPGRELQTERAKMQGYGNYVMKPDTCLFGFIAFCNIADSVRCNAASTYLTPPNINYCDYTKLVSYTGQTLSGIKTTHMNNFWSLMNSEEFNRYQDIYYYCYYTKKIVDLSGFSLNTLSNIRDNVTNGSKEFLTACTTYSYAIGKDSAPNFEVKKGDMIPFLYVKERSTSEENNENDSYIDDDEFELLKSNPYEIARYVYVALIEGWADNIDNNNLWEEEYQAVFGEQYNNDNLIADLDTLSEWYTQCKDRHKNERGNKGNNLLGSNLDTIIASDYSISQQVEAVDYYLRNIEGIGNYKDTMARNELMAKYMMENSKIDGTIKDYTVGIKFITENLQRGTQEPKNTSTVVLSDFQVIEFNHTLDKDGTSDDDGISDLKELTGRAGGDIAKDRIKWVDITGPLKKTYLSNHSGCDTGFEDELKRLFISNGGSFDENNNKKMIGQFDYKDGHAYYRTTDYISNPVLNDTDFDGIDDNKELGDEDKTNGRFKGHCGEISKIDYTNDFRYFFVDNDKYNDELAVMSLIIANGKFVNVFQLLSNDIKQYIEKIGFTNVWLKENFRISDSESIRGKLYIGKKTIQYRVYADGNDNIGQNAYKDVYGIFLMDFDNETNMKYLLANFNIDDIEEYYNNISQDIDEYVDSYVESNPSDYDSCFWVTGYSIAGGIASHVSPYLIGKGETYTYTFGAPNTTQDGSTSNANIKNIINEDDLIPKVVNRDEGYSRVGALYNDSIYDNLQLEYRKLIGNLKDYQVSPKITNTLKNKIKQAKGSVTYENFKNMLIDGMAKYFSNYNKINSSFNHRFSASESKLSTDLKELLNNNVEKVKKAHEIKAYYTLAKTLNGFDLNNYDEGWTEIDDEISADSTELDDGYDHIYVEVDWDGRYPPDEAQLQLVADSFKQHNIILHIDAGAHSVNYSDEEIQKHGQEGKEIEYIENGYAINAESLERIVRKNFSFRKNFRYCMYVDKIYDWDGNWGNGLGRADAIGGRMFQIAKFTIDDSIRRYNIYYNTEALCFMHELGHTLGLYHGGDEAINYKPNYISIMNYLYRDTGLIGMRKLNYSEYEFNKIEDFNHINEVEGIDKYYIAKEFIGINWALKSNENEYGFKIYSKYYNSSENRSMDFNRINNLENNANVDFYIEYEVESGLNGIIDFLKQLLFYDLGLFRSCRESVNDWERVYKNIIPVENIVYSAIWN